MGDFLSSYAYWRRRMKRAWALGVVALLFLFQVVSASSTFNPSRCKFIDKTPPGALSSNVTNYLVRGNLPFDSNGDFAWNEVNSTLHQIIPDMPEDYVMLDLSLLNDFDFKENEVEKKFFRRHPQLGQYLNWPIWGNVIMPDQVEAEKQQDMALNLSQWQHDDLPDKMSQLRDLLYTDNGVTTVIYIHCDAGMDRTGEVSGSYYMRWLNRTFHEALYYDDNAIEDRTINVASRNALQWYCYNLRDTQQMPQNNCTLPDFDNCGWDANRCPPNTN